MDELSANFRADEAERQLPLEESLLTGAFCVTDERAAAAFRQPALRQLIALLAKEPRGAAEVAKASGMRLNLACYHLARLQELGLIVSAGALTRGGRPIKLYRARQEAFFVPAETARRTLGSELARELRSLLERADRRMAGELFFVQGDGRMAVRKIAEDGECGSLPANELWAELRLGAPDARALFGDLRQLLSRYSGKATAGAGVFLFHAALVPRHVPVGRRRRPAGRG